MDGDGFVDPRKRSQRGRGRGGRSRGRGKGTRGRGPLKGRDAAPSTVLTADEEPKKEAPSNAFRFEKYDAMRAAARRKGGTDINFHNELSRQDDDGSNESDDGKSDRDESDFDADVARRTVVDSFVADAADEKEDDANDNAACALLRDTLAADFTGLARVLDAAPLWARLGDVALFALDADGANLSSLVDGDSHSCKEPHDLDSDARHFQNANGYIENDVEREITTDVADMMQDLDLLDRNQEVMKNPHSLPNTISASLHTEDNENQAIEDDDDGFDKWLDQV